MEAETLLCSIPGVSLPPPVFERIILLNGSGISYVCSNPGHFTEHTDPYFKLRFLAPGSLWVKFYIRKNTYNITVL